MGLSAWEILSQSWRAAWRNDTRMRWTMRVWAVACGQTVPMSSGRPFRPSQTTMHTSSTLWLRISVRTWSQYFALSPPAHSPRMSRVPSTVTARAT